MTTLVQALIPDQLWQLIAPLLPPPPRPWWARVTTCLVGSATTP
jgi:hypothetical protein